MTSRKTESGENKAGRATWLTLPSLRPSAIQAARRALPIARLVMAEEKAVMLTVILRNPGGRRRSFSIVAWRMEDGRLQPTEATGPRAASGQGRDIGIHLVDLFADLARRWPRNAQPDSIGIITDGTGIAFHGSHPDGADPQWITAHVSGRDPAAQIIEFTAGGHLSALCMPQRHSTH